MPANGFAAGESDADTFDPISQQEGIGATYKIVTSMPQGRGAHVQQRSDYLMPNVPMAWNGEPVTPAIQLTPLGGMMPSPGMPEPQVAGHQGAFPLAEDNGQFQSGVIDGWPDGIPVPVTSR